MKVKAATAEELAVRVCPLCSKPHNNKADNLYKLYISRATGQFYCHRCGASGSWFDFKARLGDLSPATAPVGASAVGVGSGGGGVGGVGGGGGGRASSGNPPSSLLDDDGGGVTPLPLEEVATAHHDLFTRDLFPAVLRYCTEERGLSPAVLKEYRVGAINRPFRKDGGGWQHEECIVFPWLQRPADDADDADADADDAEGSVDAAMSAAAAAAAADDDADGTFDEGSLTALRMKVRSVKNKAHMATHPAGGAWGMFGMHTVPDDAEELVVTEGEFDAMAVRQATGAYAVSLPNGARSLPVQLLPWLERFKRIILWLDNDATGREGCEKLVSKLGVGRCYVVRPPRELSAGRKPAKDANEALVHGYELKAMLASAARPPHEQIVTFRDLAAEVYQEFTDPAAVAGTPYRWLPSLQDTLKGHRLGELTIVTGATGSGKTTLLSQVSLDLCEQGIPTLWGSFEIKNTRLLKTMMTQLHGASLAGVDRDTFEAVGDRFTELPLHFLRFFGSTDVDRVLDAMEYAVYVNDVEHIVLDNLQFMMGSSAGRGFERFDGQEKALDKFRQFATNSNVHISLVVHPRKEPENVVLGMSSVFGTAKATQEADNVVILQATERGKFLDVRKNRFDGTVGSFGVAYNSETRTFEEVTGAAAMPAPTAVNANPPQQVQSRATVTGGAAQWPAGGAHLRPHAAAPVITYADDAARKGAAAAATQAKQASTAASSASAAPAAPARNNGKPPSSAHVGWASELDDALDASSSLVQLESGMKDVATAAERGPAKGGRRTNSSPPRPAAKAGDEDAWDFIMQ